MERRTVSNGVVWVMFGFFAVVVLIGVVLAKLPAGVIHNLCSASAALAALLAVYAVTARMPK